MPDTYFVPTAERYLIVQGRMYAQSRDMVSRGLPEKWPPNSILLFLSYANMEVPVGQTFDIVFQLDSPQQHVEAECHLAAVTQQFAKAWDLIPRGWKTISIMEFPAGIPEMIQNSPTLNQWSGSDSIGIASRETWSLLTEQPGTDRWNAEELWRYIPLKWSGVSGRFGCTQCREYVDIADRRTYWKLQRTGIISLGEPIPVAKVLEASDYWNFKSRRDHRDNLLSETMAATRKFLEKHKDHQVMCLEWLQFRGYKEFNI